MVFGLTANTQDDDFSGRGPWSGQTLDPHEVDDVVESLEETVAVLSGLGESGREFEDRIVAINSAGTPNDEPDASSGVNKLRPTRIYPWYAHRRALC